MIERIGPATCLFADAQYNFSMSKYFAQDNSALRDNFGQDHFVRLDHFAQGYFVLLDKFAQYNSLHFTFTMN